MRTTKTKVYGDRTQPIGTYKRGRIIPGVIKVDEKTLNERILKDMEEYDRTQQSFKKQ